MQRHEKVYRDMVYLWKKSGTRLPRFLTDEYQYFDEVLLMYQRMETADIPSSVYLLMDLERALGVVSVRHKLDDFLQQFGGHLSYSLSPQLRNAEAGVEEQLIYLVKDKAKLDLQLPNLMVTCSQDNVPLSTAIVRNGGVLIEEGERNGIRYLNYRIPLR